MRLPTLQCPLYSELYAVADQVWKSVWRASCFLLLSSFCVAECEVLRTCCFNLLFYRRNFGRGVGKKYSPRLSLDRDDQFHGVAFEGDGETPSRHAPGLRGLVGNGPETGSLSRFTMLTPQKMSMFCTLFAHRIHTFSALSYAQNTWHMRFDADCREMTT